jgi:hypothetical protein
MKTDLSPQDQEAVVRALHAAVRRLWAYVQTQADFKDAPPTLPDPFTEAGAVASARDAMEILLSRFSPAGNLVELRDGARRRAAKTAERRARPWLPEEAKFYARVVARKEGLADPADAPDASDPVGEAVMLRGILALALYTMPDDVIIGLNRQATIQWLAIRTEGGLVEMEEAALLRFGVTDRFLAGMGRPVH